MWALDFCPCCSRACPNETPRTYQSTLITRRFPSMNDKSWFSIPPICQGMTTRRSNGRSLLIIDLMPVIGEGKPREHRQAFPTIDFEIRQQSFPIRSIQFKSACLRALTTKKRYQSPCGGAGIRVSICRMKSSSEESRNVKCQFIASNPFDRIGQRKSGRVDRVAHARRSCAERCQTIKSTETDRRMK
jgi:hypothetical protein